MTVSTRVLTMDVNVLSTDIICEDGSSILTHLRTGDENLVFDAKDNIVLASVSAKDSSPGECFLPVTQEILILPRLL